MMIPDNYCIEVGIPRVGGYMEHVCTIELPLTRTKAEALGALELFAHRMPEYELRLMRVSCRTSQVAMRGV